MILNYFVTGLALLSLACSSAPKNSKPSVDGPMMLAWKTTLDADHALVGRIWSSEAQEFVPAQQLFAAAASHQLVLVGERHDHPDHHLLQALLVEQMGPMSIVGFEMLDELDALKIEENMTPQEIAQASDWAKSGWPSFGLYQPIFRAMQRRQITALAIHPSRERLMNRARNSKEFSKETASYIERLSAQGVATLRQDINRGHCGAAGGAMLDMMVAAQVFKDHWMASQMTSALDRRALEGNAASAARRRGLVIAGNGHVRKDYGLPNHIERSTLSIGLIEVQSGQTQPLGYDLERFDYTWFTPRLDDEDPCQKYKRALEKMKEQYRKQRSKERSVSMSK